MKWYKPGLGEVHNEDHSQMIYCEDVDGIVDDVLAKEVCDMLNSKAQPAVEPVASPEVHEPRCPALIGDRCSCEKYDVAVDDAWAQFCGLVGDVPNAPYPGMIPAFERYYSQSFADKDWRNEASVWAASWKAAKAALASPAPAPNALDAETVKDAERLRGLHWATTLIETSAGGAYKEALQTAVDEMLDAVGNDYAKTTLDQYRRVLDCGLDAARAAIAAPSAQGKEGHR